jgi:cytochrome c oxidase subunit 2
MKIIVDTPEDYKAWLKDKTIVSEVKAALGTCCTCRRSNGCGYH